MKPESSLVKFYDLKNIGREALRRAEIQTVLDSLGLLLDKADDVPITEALSNVLVVAVERAHMKDPNVSDKAGKISLPYETFEENGLTYESRVLELSGEIGEERRSVYFVALTAENVLAIDRQNIRYGIRKLDGLPSTMQVNENPKGGNSWGFNITDVIPEISVAIVDEFNTAIRNLSSH